VELEHRERDGCPERSGPLHLLIPLVLFFFFLLFLFFIFEICGPALAVLLLQVSLVMLQILVLPVVRGGRKRKDGS
jgi:hypothetical protein